MSQVVTASLPSGTPPTIMLTVDQLKEAVPQTLKNTVTQELTDRFNAGLAQDPAMLEYFSTNAVSYASVLKDGRYKVQDYLNAVAYVSYKLMDCTNMEAYQRTFPKRYQALVASGADDKKISAYVSAYNKGKLVNAILEQSLVPIWVLNQHLRQKAINRQAWLMENAQSEKVQTEAANSLLTHLKQPEAAKVEVDLTVKDTSGMQEMKDMLMGLARRQQELIAQGISTRTIAHQDIHGNVVDGDMKDVTPVTKSDQGEGKSEG